MKDCINGLTQERHENINLEIWKKNSLKYRFKVNFLLVIVSMVVHRNDI